MRDKFLVGGDLVFHSVILITLKDFLCMDGICTGGLTQKLGHLRISGQVDTEVGTSSGHSLG